MSSAAETFGGRVAVITGASAGIGAGFARHAASLGMKLVLADIAAERLTAVADELAGAGAEVEAVVTDVADPASVDALADRACERFGAVDLLVNNAGIMAMGYSWEIPAERWDAALRVNVGGYVNGIRSFVPRLIERGTKAWIVNVSSVGGLFPSPLMAPYSVTKFGTLALTESLAYELRMKGADIQVSVVLPDSVRSEIFRAARPGDSAGDGTHDGTPPEIAGFNDMLQARADTQGITADEHARRCFEQIAEGRYWVTPQPEMIDAGLPSRTEMILRRTNPELDLGAV
ncbi:SDR family NAD(P)-dependent oxidoreductase [Streptomyces kanamyceticus]|uniref:SDR family NAD(P)-dependent oxidoreductase n=1 Tax=Streptomyces kanamyceticus TaxID=1967 RepID=A0A5J6GIF5_STRKN|nr:SDR family NAD(P)-dependent oxidoreductase [Streptomyces kanamyceticus]QEU94847.1 SDR family NAD(P)-dependent oxidoreductase [Streptomyces kanamyceticus]